MSDSGISGPSLILLVRHGATEWSESGMHTGRTDLPLTEKGRHQADRLPPLLATLSEGALPIVFASPLQRAFETARRGVPGVEPTVVDALAEYDYGEYEGLTSAEIEERHPGWNLFYDGCPGGESLHQVVARCDGFVAKLERTAAGRTAIVFTHGHLSRILTTRLVGLEPQAGAVLQNDAASVGVITDKRGQYVIVGWNIRAQ
ncbi:MAG TPA: histidine phosphatase family protein [Ilumatobacteraceae bacterium]|nr:histidine phosphatase family protein [Ilumatobacteraceae bacterium]